MTDVPDVGPVPVRIRVDPELVRQLVAMQFPQWAGLPIKRVASEGWDNQTFHLGEDMLVRLPSAAPYALAVEKEHRWLPVLAGQLPLPIPVPLAKGVPANGYPHAWSIYRFLDGEPADSTNIADLPHFAIALARFLRALQRIDPTDGPAPGLHNWYRGGSPAAYGKDTLAAIESLDGHIPADLATEIWDAALRATWDGRPVWFHGDVATGNLLVQDGALAGVIDFGTCGVGDPACDLTIAWTLLSGASRQAFRTELCVDAATWARGRGWALWKALIGYAGAVEDGESESSESRPVLEQIFAEYEQR